MKEKIKKFSYVVLLPVIALFPFLYGAVTNEDVFTGEKLADSNICFISLNVLPNCEDQK